MLLTPHILFALYLTSVLPVWIALPLAFMSHMVFDFMLPHWNPHIFTELKKFGKIQKPSLAVIVVDCLTSLGFVLYFASKAFPDISAITVIFLAAFLSILPDIVEIPYYFFNYRSKNMKKIMDFQHRYQARGDVIWGNLSQWGLATLCLYFLLQ